MMARRPGHPADQARSGQIAADRVLDVTRFGLPLRLFAAPQPRLGCCPPHTAVPTGEHHPRPGLDDLAERSQVPGSTAPYPTPGPVPARTGRGRRQAAPRAPAQLAPAAPGRSLLRPRSSRRLRRGAAVVRVGAVAVRGRAADGRAGPASPLEQPDDDRADPPTRARRPDPCDARASLILLTGRSRRFVPVVAAVLAELDRLARRRLGPRRVAKLKAALAELIDLG